MIGGSKNSCILVKKEAQANLSHTWREDAAEIMGRRSMLQLAGATGQQQITLTAQQYTAVLG